VEPEFRALNFPTFEPEEAMPETATNEETQNAPWYASPLCPWNWIYPFVGAGSPVPPVAGSPGAQGSAPSGSSAAPGGGAGAPHAATGNLIPGGKKKKKKSKLAETVAATGTSTPSSGASAGSTSTPPAGK
jgi:hypothetical protein